MKFKVSDVSVPDVPGAFTSFYIKDTPVLCIPSWFTHHDHYAKFMGYDKPFDLEADDNKPIKEKLPPKNK